MNRIILIRHGNTDMLGHVLCGRQAAVHLNEEGQQQAQRLGSYLRQHDPLHVVFSSPLERALETAELVATPFQLPVSTDERLQEVDFGSWTGKTFAELGFEPGWRDYNRARSLHHAPGGESFPALQGRVADFLQQCAEDYKNQTIAVVTHGDVIRSALCLCLGIPLDFLLRFAIDTISVSEIIFDSKEPFVKRINWLLPPEHPV